MMKLGILGIFLGWILLYWWKPLFLGTTLYSGYTGSSDLTDGFLPMFAFLQRSLQEGHFPPLWNSYSLNGAPFLAEGQVGVFYPFHFLAALPLPPLAILNLLLALDMLLAAVFTALLARSIGLSLAGALLAGLVFGGCGFFVTHCQHVNMVHAAAWLPAILGGLRQVQSAPLRSHRQVAWGLVLALFIGLQHLAGHPQITYMTWLGLAFYWVGRAWAGRGEPGRLAWESGILALALLLGTALAAVQLLPTAEFARVAGRLGGLDLAWATHSSFPPDGLPLFLYPFFFGDPSRATYLVNESRYGVWQENCVYIGWVPLGLALMAFASRRWQLFPLLPFLLIWGLMALVLAMGTATPWYVLAREVLPGFALFRYPARYTLWMELALALLAGAGLTRLQEAAASRNQRFWPWLWPIGIGTVLLASVLDLHGLFARYHQLDGRREDWTRPPTLIAVLGKEQAPSRVYAMDAVAIHQMAYSIQRGWHGPPRALQQLREDLHANVNVMLRLESPDALLYTLRLPRQQRQLSWLKERMKGGMFLQPMPLKPGVSELLGAWNVQYLTSYRPLRHPDWEPAGEVHLDWEGPVLRLYRHRRVLPRFYLVGRSIVPRRPLEFPTEMNRYHDILSRAVLLEQPAGAGSADIAGSRWQLEDYTPERWTGQATMTAAGFLVQLESFYPGWKARVDGQEVPIYRANGLFRAIALPPGWHRLEMVYDPASYRWGVRLSLLALLVLLGSGIWLILPLGRPSNRTPRNRPGKDVSLEPPSGKI